MTITEKLRAFMGATGISRADLARMSKVDKAKISNLLNHPETYRVNQLEWAVDLANAIRTRFPGATIDWLVSDEQAWPPPEEREDFPLSGPEKDLVQHVRLVYGGSDPDLAEVWHKLMATPARHAGPAGHAGNIAPAQNGQTMQIELLREKVDWLQNMMLSSRKPENGGPARKAGGEAG